MIDGPAFLRESLWKTLGVQIRKKNFDFVYLFLDGTMQIRKLFTGFGKASLTINGFGNLQGDWTMIYKMKK